MTARPRILVVDDRAELPEICRAGLGDRVDVRWAQTLAEARKLFTTIDRPDVIVLDGYLTNETTVTLAAEFRRSFDGPMVAASSSQRMNNELMHAGCSHIARNKRDVVAILQELLPMPAE